MPRAVSNVPRLKRKKQIMKAARGAFGARSKLWRPAKETVERGWKYAYRDRKNKKRDFRRLAHPHQRRRAPERHELQHVHERAQARGHRSQSQNPRGPRGLRSRRVYGARRQGAHRVERSVRHGNERDDPPGNTLKLGGGSATKVVAAAALFLSPSQ